jgi:hypothetical protein
MLMKMRKTWRKREENKEETMKKYLIMAMWKWKEKYRNNVRNEA